MRKNVQINVGVSSDWMPRTPKNNQQSMNLPNLGQSYEPRTTGNKVPKIGIDALGLTPTALARKPSREGRRGSKVESQYEHLYQP